ncbi:hypothetical protein L1987_24537 [Smallanthus sonchifolius]|uniref:Uncharacterized protein n=1 Tax=Smallanthus sonchifolius TaxID=185202 RepID=A0ACB9IJY9_9ASTR|nr:hypothetical protein L1987_24537 [Smallanthus sonchifolius]
MEAQALSLSTNLRMLTGSNALLDRTVSTATSRACGFSGSCSVPGLPEFIIGLDQRVAELKYMLLKEDTRRLVVSAPGGIFGDNILYVTVSTETSLKSIAQSLFKHYDINDFQFSSEEDTKNQIENLIRQKGSGNMLLVLDDVWSKSESVIQDLKFEIPGFKILVTSVSKMVESCKGIPLALTVVGASLCRQPEVKWRATLRKWSQGQSILKSHEQLLLCLQTSVDALDELHKSCFLDLGMFPEDDRIAGTALMDMWMELYNLDDDQGLDALLRLSSRNLINLVPIRKAAGEIEGHCNEEFNSTWYDLNAPNVEVLILNIRSENYTLPEFIKRMSQLKIGDALNSGTIASPYMPENLKDREFDLCYDLKELPAGLCSYVHLQKLIITNSQELDALPKDLGNRENLEILRLHCCTKLKELRESIIRLGKLSLFDISDCSSITALPKQIDELSSLRFIDISGCEGLEMLPMSLTRLKKLKGVWCDEERSYLWKSIESDLCNVKINFVEEDRSRTLKKICQ